MININNLHSIFKLPITYNDSVKNIPDVLCKDLELSQFTENSESCLYDNVFTPTNIFGKELLQQWNKYYTTDTYFLKDSQKLIKKLQINSKISSTMSNKIFEIWQDIKNDKGFKERYQYVEWNMLEFLNHSATFLEVLSLYTLTSPILSLISPIIIIILPFFILKIQSKTITIQTYFSNLVELFKKIPIGRIFDLHNLSWEKRFYAILSFVFYIAQIYQNLQFCHRFKKNMLLIHGYIEQFKLYVNETISNMSNFITYSSVFKSYTQFTHALNEERLTLIDFKEELDKITPYAFNIKKISNIGHVMKIFYEIYENVDYHNALLYSFGFNGYLDNISSLKQKINSKAVSKCTFSKSKLNITDGYYCTINKNRAVSNTYNLNKNIIITGPNAAGKTTLLKSTLFNILLSQQIGYGFYKKATIKIFDHFHCYINIPDTAGRDSLFQAEARRCKNILESIEKYPNEKHFCIFDELYSGTNPYEAISSAHAYLLYLNNNPNVKFILTTHYIKLCELLDNKTTPPIINKNMDVICSNSDFSYTYKIVDGISGIKGGIKVLKDLKYPNDILNNTQKILLTL